MPVNIVPKGEAMAVGPLVFVIYGDPGVGKTSLAFSAEKPLLLDFDSGSYRSEFRGDTVPISTWADIANIQRSDLQGYKTIVIDTVGRCLDVLLEELAAGNPGLLRRTGAPTMQGYGALKAAFVGWIKRVRSWNLDLVLIAHDATEDRDGEAFHRPEIVGGSRVELFKIADGCGYMRPTKGGRVLEWEPNERWLGKDPAGLGTISVPHLFDEPNALDKMIRKVRETLMRGDTTSVPGAQPLLDAIRNAESVEELAAVMPMIREAPVDARVFVVPRFDVKARKLGSQRTADGQLIPIE